MKSSLLWLFIIAGLWLIIAPFVLGYAQGAAMGNDLVVGIILALVGLWWLFGQGLKTKK